MPWLRWVDVSRHAWALGGKVEGLSIFSQSRQRLLAYKSPTDMHMGRDVSVSPGSGDAPSQGTRQVLIERRGHNSWAPVLLMPANGK
jgi:hypothetical protein